MVPHTQHKKKYDACKATSSGQTHNRRYTTPRMLGNNEDSLCQLNNKIMSAENKVLLYLHAIVKKCTMKLKEAKKCVVYHIQSRN